RRTRLERRVGLLGVALGDRAAQLRDRLHRAVLALRGGLVGRDVATVVTAEGGRAPAVERAVREPVDLADGGVADHAHVQTRWPAEDLPDRRVVLAFRDALAAVIILRRPGLQRAVGLLDVALEDRAGQLRRRLADAVLALERGLVGRDEAAVVTTERCTGQCETSGQQEAECC